MHYIKKEWIWQWSHGITKKGSLGRWGVCRRGKEKGMKKKKK
jgi:hypothetical protein